MILRNRNGTRTHINRNSVVLAVDDYQFGNCYNVMFIRGEYGEHSAISHDFRTESGQWKNTTIDIPNDVAVTIISSGASAPFVKVLGMIDEAIYRESIR